MPILQGWGTDNRVLLLHLVRGIDLLERAERRNGTYLNPEVSKARVEMLAYVHRGGTSATHGSVPTGTQSVAPSRPFVMLSVSATSSALGITESMVRRHCRNGTLAGIKLGSSWHIDPASIESHRRSTNGRPSSQGPQGQPGEAPAVS
jgi:hypothetical protein